jgi:hypothetical protein
VAFVVPPDLNNDGTSGGEVLLSVPDPGGSSAQEFAEQRLKVRTGDWLLLAGPRPDPAMPPPPPIPRFQWYQVVHVDPDVTLGASGYQRYVTLMGRDWYTYPVAGTPNPVLAPVPAYAVLMEGVVGVYEKTIRLEYGSSF